MKYFDISFRNFRSFGNKLQKIEFNTNGSLNLLTGKNGSGKTNFRLVVEFLHHSLCIGKHGKKLPIKKLVNKYNNTFSGGIRFLNDFNQLIHIKKSLNPNNIQILLNENDYTEIFKKLNPDEKIKILGINHETYNTFVGLNFENFNNFISLSKESKENVINKLFNYNKVNDYISVVDENIKYYNNQIKNINKLLVDNKENLKNIQSSLNNKKVKNTEELNIKLEEYKNKFNTNKTIYTEKLEQLKKIEEQHINTKKLVYVKNLKHIELKNNINLLEKEKSKILNEYNLHKTGKCPTCNNQLILLETHEKEYNDKILEYTEKINSLKVEYTIIKNEYDDLVVECDNVYKSLNKINTEYLECKNLLSNCKNSYEEIKNKLEEVDDNSENDIIVELNKKISTYSSKVLEFEEALDSNKKLKDILCSDDLKKKTINSIINPLNTYISEYSKKFNIGYNLRLDKDYNAIIKDNRNELDENDISSGEERQANLIIALSYLNLLLEFKTINIMFLDEIFTNIDVEKIEVILSILKELSIKYKINMFVVHHSELNLKHFDYVYRVEKKTFSDFSIEKL